MSSLFKREPVASKRGINAPPAYRPQTAPVQTRSTAPPVYRPQIAPVQRKLTAPAVYRPQNDPIQRKIAAPPVYRPQPAASQRKAAPAVYRPQPSPSAASRTTRQAGPVQRMSTASWVGLGAVGGFVGAAGLAVLSAPVTFPTLAVGAATLGTAALAPLIGGYLWPSRPAQQQQTPPQQQPLTQPIPTPRTLRRSESSVRDEKSELKIAEPEPDFFAGVLPASIRVDLRHGDVTSSGAHHTDFEFRFAGTRQTKRYNLDPWIVGNKAIVQPRGQSAAVTGLVRDWACNDSIVDHLVNRLLLTSHSAEPLEGTVASAHLATDGPRAFVLHLMALRANIAQRVGDIGANCPSSAMIVPLKKGGGEPETVQINWRPIFKNGRERVKAEILAGHRCPGKDAVLCAHQALAAADQPGLNRLRDLGFLVGGQFVKSAGGRKLQGGDNSLNFAVGHLRFILYLEWRAVDELIVGN